MPILSCYFSVKLVARHGWGGKRGAPAPSLRRRYDQLSRTRQDAAPKDPAPHTSCITAQSFVETFYHHVSENKSIANLYTSNSPAYQAVNKGSDLNINGAVVARPEDYERILANQRRLPFGFEKIRYVADNWDYHILNAEFNMGAPPDVLGAGNPKRSDRLMLTVMVSGTVFFGSDKDGFKKTFHETFVLVPNWELFAKKTTPKNAVRYLILSQNYRAI